LPTSKSTITRTNATCPAKPGTSQLSPYLAAGVLSPRQCLHAALHSNNGEFESGSPGQFTWITELLWREFYKHILVGYPRVSRHRAFRPETEYLPWRNAPDELAPGNRGAPASRLLMPPSGNCWKPAGCTTACAW
jgi:deoxyribodipyrimidine photolyase